MKNITIIGTGYVGLVTGAGLSEFGNKQVSTNSISKILNIEPASVTDMLKKLSKKNLVYHEKYKGSTISKSGIKIALQIIRRHRLWEVFLHDKLKFKWDEIHEIAEEDVALCEYICPSKIEWQDITRRGLDFIERET